MGQIPLPHTLVNPALLRTATHLLIYYLQPPLSYSNTVQQCGRDCLQKPKIFAEKHTDLEHVTFSTCLLVENIIGNFSRHKRDESMWVAIHMCMEAMLGISLYGCLYPKLAETLSYCLLCFLFNKTGEQEGRTGSAWSKEGWGQSGKVAQTMCAPMNKCKNNKKEWCSKYIVKWKSKKKPIKLRKYRKSQRIK
jgi:hypothetical protein